VSAAHLDELLADLTLVQAALALPGPHAKPLDSAREEVGNAVNDLKRLGARDWQLADALTKGERAADARRSGAHRQGQRRRLARPRARGRLGPPAARLQAERGCGRAGGGGVMHATASPWAGFTVVLTSGQHAGKDYHVEDWWDRIAGKSWMHCDGNPACMIYAIDSAFGGDSLDDEVLYGKIGSSGHLIHVRHVEAAT
jgi:hypothetical protein